MEFHFIHLCIDFFMVGEFIRELTTRCRPVEGVSPLLTGRSPIFLTISILISAQGLESQDRRSSPELSPSRILEDERVTGYRYDSGGVA